MALKRVDEYEARGKTLKGVYYRGDGRSLMIVFEDGTYLGMQACQTYDGDPDGFEECKIDCDDLREEDWVESGFYTQEELDRIKQNEERAMAKYNEAMQRQKYMLAKAAYEELKGKYEPNS